MPDGTRLLRRNRSTAYPAPPPNYAGDPMTSEGIRTRALDSAPRNPFLRHPIFRGIYLVFFILSTVFILVPFWAVYYVPRWNRMRRSWTVKRCVRVRWSRRFCGVVARCELDYLGRDLKKRLEPTKLSHSHPVYIPPAPAEWLRGHPAQMLEHLLSTRGKWMPQFINRPSKAGPWGKWNPAAHEHREEYGFTTVPAFWFNGPKEYPKATRRPRKQGEPVMLFFHGGGYVVGTAAEHDLTSSIPKSLVNHTPIKHVLSVDYRLAGNAPWPLPLLDAISAYAYIITEGVDERDLIIGGDSAGGHLAFALTRWIRDEGCFLGLRGPRALLGFSPWSDVGFTHQWSPAGLEYNADCDMIDDTFGLFASGLLTRALPENIMHTSTYLSPASLMIPATRHGAQSFEGFPPVFITMGGAERIGLEITELYHRIKLARATETPDELCMSTDAVHDFLIFPWFAAESAVVYARLDEWLRTLLSEDDEDEDEIVDMSLPSPIATPHSVRSQLSQLAGRRSPLSPHMAPPLSPLSPLSPTSPMSPFLRAERRASRTPAERAALRSARSPRMRPVPDSPAQLFEDLRHDGMHLLHLDVPELEIGSSVSTLAAQYDGEEEGTWHEMGEGDSEDEEESEFVDE